MEPTAQLYPPSLPIPYPDRSHAIDPNSEVTVMETGRARIRRLYEEPLESVNVLWSFTGDQYEAFETFFIETLANGSLPFVMDWADSQVWEFAFIGARFNLSRMDGSHIVSAALLVLDKLIGEESVGSSGSGAGGVDNSYDSSSSGVLSDESASGSGAGGGGGPPAPNSPPFDPTLDPWDGAGTWGPISVTDPGNEETRFVGIPNAFATYDEMTAYVNTFGQPGCLDAWIAAVWHDFLTYGPGYSTARIVWGTAGYMTGSNFNATQAFPNDGVGFWSTSTFLFWTPQVQYVV